MEQLMANMHDEKFSLYLVRYHNSKVRDSLQDLGLYIQMLIARFDSTTNSKCRVISAEIVLIESAAKETLNHFIIAEEITHAVAQQHHENLINATISETDDLETAFGVSGQETRVSPLRKARQERAPGT